MNEPLFRPHPQLTAVSYDKAGCFPFIVGTGIAVTLLALLGQAGAPWLFLFIGSTTFLALITRSAWQQRRQFVQQSVVTQGQITRLWQETVDDGEGGKSTSYYVAYTFAGGQETKQPITAEQCLFAELGDAVTVRYVPDQPHHSQVDWQLMLREKLRALENAQLQSTNQ